MVSKCMTLEITMDRSSSNNQFRARMPIDDPNYNLVGIDGIVVDARVLAILQSLEPGDTIYIEISKNKDTTPKPTV